MAVTLLVTMVMAISFVTAVILVMTRAIAHVVVVIVILNLHLDAHGIGKNA
ncbi:MAG: hypothetical protein JJ934_07685 [Pseudomonadales bacterium]|nr:hypothetical protein [Pseudomonadales bacterium]MBO6595893.1 hypothetical protein [Pseudomonadales bacterium]MBO6656758.1 hypothetical protein [Pseudomonadales bacterium]MBO6702498.1 hypothetical protein [Pseudomonadales bacterium]MBO6822377.1 hypothetical protein [Pseudomonadales bacterium]